MNETEQQQSPVVIETPIIKKQENATLRFIYSIFVAFSIIFIFGIFFGRIVFFPIEVQGASMQPTLNAKEEARDIVYLGSDRKVTYGDIIVFDSGLKRDGKSQNYIKRIVAMPGDTVEFKAHSQDQLYIYYDFYVNGILQEEKYIKEPMRILKTTQDDNELAFFQTFLESNHKLTLENNQFFLMGDNRNNSLDSRHLGPIEKNKFVGKVYLHIKSGETLLKAIFDKIF